MRPAMLDPVRDLAGGGKVTVSPVQRQEIFQGVVGMADGEDGWFVQRPVPRASLHSRPAIQRPASFRVFARQTIRLLSVTGRPPYPAARITSRNSLSSIRRYPGSCPDPTSALHHDVILGQEVQGRRAVRPREQHHAPGLRDARPGPTLNALRPSPASLPLQACRRSVVHNGRGKLPRIDRDLRHRGCDRQPRDPTSRAGWVGPDSD